MNVEHVKDDVALRCQELLGQFMNTYTDPEGVLKYCNLANNFVDNCQTLTIDFDDIVGYNEALATTIIEEYFRVYTYLSQAVSDFVSLKNNVTKECYVAFVGIQPQYKLRELLSNTMGTLIRTTGQVVRVHKIRPELIRGTFVCILCRTVMITVVAQDFQCTIPPACRNPLCTNRDQFILDTDKSSFVNSQQICIQEQQSELRRGAIPMSLNIILRADNVNIVHGGDRCNFTGTLLSIPYKTRDGDLKFQVRFVACSVEKISTGGGFDECKLDEHDELLLLTMSSDTNLFDNLINSLFPSIHAQDNVKRGALLILLGGVTKITIDKTSLRGDINMCIVGDASMGKSQLLQLVAECSPRAVYTVGNSSSAAGLTAAVVKDEETNEFMITAGALMMADKGICCIDEFDKMTDIDRSAIHEAMEQQTISIAKAGIHATLNARASILAAANPIGGRYDLTKSIEQNVNLSSPIMSRFDLFFFLIDLPNKEKDHMIADKILNLHRNAGVLTEQIYRREDVIRYINIVRRLNPILTDEAKNALRERYVILRRDKAGGRITVRQLESMIRLSEAISKMECSLQVLTRHVDKAYQLLAASIEPPNDDDNNNAVEAVIPKSTKNFLITAEQYQQLAYMLITHIRLNTGMTKANLIDWYINQIINQSDDDLIINKMRIEFLIKRLITIDKVLLSTGDDAFLTYIENSH